jgi:Bacteriophage CI repressor helix-turn-helix domain
MLTDESIFSDFSEEMKGILSRVCDVSDGLLSSDSAVARELGVNRGNPAQWKKRGTTPFDIFITYAKKKEINIHWLLTGEGESSVAQMSTHDKAQHHDIARSMYLDDVEADKRVQERNIPTAKKIEEVSTYIHENLTIDNNHPDYELVKTMLFKLLIQTDCENSEFERFTHYLNTRNNVAPLHQDDLTRSIRVVSTILGERWSSIDETAKAKLIAKTYEYFQQIDDGDQHGQEQVMGKIMNEVLTTLS